MSTRLNDYPFLKQSTFRHHAQRQQMNSPQDTSSNASINTDLEKAMVTPPTPYYGDDELSGLTAVGSSYIKQDDSGDDEKSAKIKPDLSGSSTEDEKDQELIIDHICAGEANGPCTLGSGDHRKVISHVFGRNKRETHQIPDDCWIKYCRKHYQRHKYRCPADWPETQLLLVDAQIDKMEAWGGIASWTIAIRKKEREMLDNENSYLAQHGRLPDGPRCRERFLLPYLGSNKTFADIRNLINIIDQESENTNSRTLPSFEFLPLIDERRNPRPKRFGAVRHLARSGAVTNSSTFRLTTDSNGKVCKTEASPSSTPSRAPSRVPHRARRLPKVEKGPRKGIKRSASSSEEEDEKPDIQQTRPAKRHHHVKTEAKPTFSHPVQAKYQPHVEDEEKKPEIENLLPIRRHTRSLSF